jgi:hypothetical protein
MNTITALLIGLGFGIAGGLAIAILILRNSFGPHIENEIKNEVKRLVQKGRGNTNSTDLDADQKKERWHLFKNRKKH